MTESGCKGQVITLLGRSGVGKTQLLKVIAGLQKPSGGNVLVGKEQLPVQPGVVGMVLQNYPLFAHRTLYSNLSLVSRKKDQIDSYLNDFDLIAHKDKYPSQLSGGQKQRAAIVQQLLCSEHFILLDEPFSGLDPVATEKLVNIISKVANQDESNTVIISTHIIEPALAISDSVLMLGTEVKEGIPAVGATIRYTYDLASNGLAWRPDIRKDVQFIKLVEDIRNIFQTL